MKIAGLLGLTAAGVVLAVPSVAQADTQSYSDPGGDAVDFKTNEVVAESKVGDVTDVSLDFATTGFTAEVTMRDIDPALVNGAFFSFKDNLGRRAVFRAARLVDGTNVSDFGRESKPVDCGAKAEFNPETEVITMTAPRRCFAKVKWLRVGVYGFAGTEAPGLDDQFYVDDSRRDGKADQFNIKRGPRLYKS